MVYTPTGDPNINPMGAIAVFDNESPCIFSARVIANVSGGQFVAISGTDGAGIVGSTASSYVTNDINVCPALLFDNIGGIALYNVASGTSNYVAVARKGSFLVQSTGAVSGGAPVVFNSGGVAGLFELGSASIPGAAVFNTIGRVKNSADSGAYVLLDLNL